MRNEHLQSILLEYRPSMRIDILVGRKKRQETTVLEVVTRLMKEPPQSSVTILGRTDLILRERTINADRPTHGEWLEMDLR